MRPSLLPVWIAGLLALAAPCSGAEPAGNPQATRPAGSDRLDAACEYGVTLALLGQPARAESAFIWLLGQSPGDPRALSNLGSLALLKGDPELALSYYVRAASADSADAGIVLNQATALMLLGDEEAAQERAALGVRKAGGARAAGHFLGLRYEGADPGASRGAPKAYISREELTALLRAAAGHVPRDSAEVGAEVPGTSTPDGVKPAAGAPVWRSAGARAGDQDAAALVYWKR